MEKSIFDIYEISLLLQSLSMRKQGFSPTIDSSDKVHLQQWEKKLNFLANSGCNAWSTITRGRHCLFYPIIKYKKVKLVKKLLHSTSQNWTAL